MGPWIQAVKDQTQDIIRTLRNEHKNSDFEVAVVGYRDYKDVERFKIVNFTSDITSIIIKIQDIRAVGGDDDAEDVANGLLYTSQLSWNEKADVKMVFHIADAPAHGLRYHDPDVSDRFPQGDPEGVNPEVTLRTMAEQGIDYTFVKITSSTNVMLRRFAEAYEGQRGKFMVTDLTPQSTRREFGLRTPSDALSPMVIRSVTQRISSQDPKEGLYNPIQTTDSQDRKSVV